MDVRGLLLVVVCVASASAAERPDGTIVLPVVDKQDIRFVTLSAGGEVLNKWIKGITQDNQGFMWFATNGGLYRYDGYTITPFAHDSNNPNSVSTDNLNAIYKDQSGILWIGNANDGLDRFDPAGGVFTHFRHKQGVEASLSHDTILDIYQDRSGTLWVGTDAGLDRFDPSTRGFVHYRHNLQDPSSLTHDDVTAVYEDSHATLRVGTGLGLNALDRATSRSTHFLHDPKNPHSLANDFIGSIVEDRFGVLWVGSPVGGVLNALDVKTGEFTHYFLFIQNNRTARAIRASRGCLRMPMDPCG